MSTMYDAIPALFGNVPADPWAFACYVDGYGGYDESVKRWPNAHHLSITIHGHRARCADFEKGAMGISEGPGWYHDHADHTQGKPVMYASASRVAALIAMMVRAGVSRSSYFVWSAHFTGQQHICGPHTCGYPQADMTQWYDKVNRRACDISEVPASVFEAGPVDHRAHGTARATLGLDLATGHWSVRGAAGTDVHFGKDDHWASAELQINVRTGQWRVHPLARNSPPLGG